MKLYPYQLAAVAKAKVAANRWIFNDETGLGKSGQAVTACKELGAKRILIICPANVRSHWIRELDRWWPDHPGAGVIFAGEANQSLSKVKLAALQAARVQPITIYSHNLFTESASIHEGASSYDAIILDECHRFQRPASTWSKAARALTRRHQDAAIFGLTATLIPNRPQDFWNIGDIMWPGRYGEGKRNGKGEVIGHSWKYLQRYTNASYNGYGWSYKGIAADTAEELRHRISAVSSRTTKQEVANLLPPFMVRKLICETSDALRESKAWAAEEVATGEATHFAILTHLRKTARQVAVALSPLSVEAQCPLVCLTGDDSVAQREDKLEQLRTSASGILVATMHSVGIGIDLTWCTRALFAELYWRPETIIQALGRFSRLSGKVPSSVDIMALPGTPSEKIALVLEAKLAAIGDVTQPSMSEDKLVTAITSIDEVKFLADLKDMAASMDLDNEGAAYNLFEDGDF